MIIYSLTLVIAGVILFTLNLRMMKKTQKGIHFGGIIGSITMVIIGLIQIAESGVFQ